MPVFSRHQPRTAAWGQDSGAPISRLGEEPGQPLASPKPGGWRTLGPAHLHSPSLSLSGGHEQPQKTVWAWESARPQLKACLGLPAPGAEISPAGRKLTTSPAGPGGEVRVRAAASPGDRLAPSPPAASGAAVKPGVGAAGPEHQEAGPGEAPSSPFQMGASPLGQPPGQASARTQAQQMPAGRKVDTPDSICDS